MTDEGNDSDISHSASARVLRYEHAPGAGFVRSAASRGGRTAQLAHVFRTNFSQRPFFANPRHARLTHIVGFLVTVWMVFSQWNMADNGSARKGRAEQAPLYGMWDVVASSESIPWRRFVVPYEGTGLTISTSESASLFQMRVDTSGKTLDLTPETLSRTIKPGPSVRFRFDQPNPDALLLHSDSTGGVTQLRRVPPSAVPLVSHRHRWYW